MKNFFFLILIFSHVSHAHSEHGDGLALKAALPGASVFHLESEWKDQKGKDIKLVSLRGNPRLVAMLFTRCDTACPLIVEDLKEIAREIDGKRAKPIDVSIFSLDSFRETPESLLKFSVQRKIPSHWGLFTSNADAVKELAAVLGVQYKRLPNGDFIHSNVLFFLNGNGEVMALKEGIKSPRKEFIKKVESNL